MNKRVIGLFIFLPFILLCSRKTITRNYYLVELPKTVEISQTIATEQLPYIVDVRDFQVAKAFEQTRIALRTASNEINYYHYHHWAVRPAYALSDQLRQTVDRMRLFQQVNRGFSYSPHFIMTGIVHSIERYHINNQQSAHLAVTFQLIDLKTELPVVRYEFDQMKKLEKSKSMNAFAQVISEIFYQETLSFTAMITDYLGNLQE